MADTGHSVQVLYASGGLSKNKLFVQMHADITGEPLITSFIRCRQRDLLENVDLNQSLTIQNIDFLAQSCNFSLGLLKTSVKPVWYINEPTSKANKQPYTEILDSQIVSKGLTPRPLFTVQNGDSLSKNCQTNPLHSTLSRCSTCVFCMQHLLLIIPPVFDVVGLPIVVSHEVESVLIGAAILGACASGEFASVQVR